MTGASEPSSSLAGRQGVLPRRASRTLGLVLGAHLLAGVAVGVLWRVWSPSTFGYAIAGPGSKVVIIPDESESQIAGDGRFLLLCTVVALLAAAAMWQLRPERGVVGLAALAIGSLISALTARQVGVALASGHRSAALNPTVRLPLTLHANALLTAQALIAVAVYVLLAGLCRSAALGADTGIGGSGVDGSGVDGSGVGGSGVGGSALV